MQSKFVMQKTVLGFVPSKSFVYGIHPIVRLSLYFALSTLPLCVEMPEINFGITISLLILFVAARIDLRKMKLFAPMTVTVGFFIMLVHIFFPPSVENDFVFKQIFGINIYYHAIMRGISVYFRIIVLIYISVFYFYTNRERDILVAFRGFKVPFAVSYFIGITLRSAGMFIDDFRTINEAERARGMFVEDLSFFGKIKHYAMYMIPLFTLAIRRSDEISIALHAKGTTLGSKVNGVKRPDYLLHQTPVGVGEYIAIFLCVLLIAGAIYLQFLGYFDVSRSPLNIACLNYIKGGI